MAKKSKKPAKKSSKKGTKKIKFNKGTPYEVDWVYVEPVRTMANKILDFWTNLVKKIKNLF